MTAAPLLSGSGTEIAPSSCGNSSAGGHVLLRTHIGSRSDANHKHALCGGHHEFYSAEGQRQWAASHNGASDVVEHNDRTVAGNNSKAVH